AFAERVEEKRLVAVEVRELTASGEGDGAHVEPHSEHPRDGRGRVTEAGRPDLRLTQESISLTLVSIHEVRMRTKHAPSTTQRVLTAANLAATSSSSALLPALAQRASFAAVAVLG